MYDYRNNEFEGTLLDIIEEARDIMPSGDVLRNSHKWILSQIENKDVLPLRKFCQHPMRGSVFGTEDYEEVYVPVDNEPLTNVYETLKWKSSS